MIRPNNPEIDVEELMNRVRAEAARIRGSGKIEERRANAMSTDDSGFEFQRELEQHRIISVHIETADRLNRPRTELPKRLQRVARIGQAPFRFILRVFNYLMKPQREVSANQNAALRRMIAMDVRTGEYLAKLAERVRALESSNMKQALEMNQRLDALVQADQVTRSSAEQLREQLERDMAILQEQRERDAATFQEQRMAAVAELQQQLAAISARLNAVTQRAEHGHARIDSGERTMATFDARLASTPVHSDVRAWIAEVALDAQRRIAESVDRALRSDALLRGDIADLRGRLGDRPTTGEAAKVQRANEEELPAGLYAAIEDAFRGNREVIRARLAEHVAAVRLAGTVGAETPLLDLGTGRGDWIAVLQEHEIPARGVDSNAIAVNEARAEGLAVDEADLFEALEAVPAASLGAVTAFHVVEHLPVGALLRLLQAAFRALVPGGLLLLETPDPRNITVATWGFRLDPTHRHAIPDPLLAVVVESAGFADVRVQRLHPSTEAVFEGEGQLVDQLNALFGGPQDYALLARRPG